MAAILKCSILAGAENTWTGTAKKIVKLSVHWLDRVGAESFAEYYNLT